jgi:hypothetical protein
MKRYLQTTILSPVFAQNAPDLFQRVELLANRQPGEPHPWVDPDHFQRWSSELIASTQQYLAES